jgi:HEAT repeat protein
VSDEVFPPADEAAAALDAANRLLREGRTGELVEDVLHDVASEATWVRAQALGRLAALPDASTLIDPLVAALRDPESAERRNAARSALAALAGPESGTATATLEVLSSLLRTEADSDVRLLTATALGESGNLRAAGELESSLGDPEANVGAAAADALGQLAARGSVGALAGALRRADPWVRVAAIVALGRIGDARAVPPLAEALADPMLAAAAAGALGEIRDPASLEALRPLVTGDGASRGAAVRAAAGILAAHPDVEPPDWLRASLRGRETELAESLLAATDETAALLLGIAGTEVAAQRLADALQGPSETAAAGALSLLPAAVAASLTARLPDATPEGRASILAALPSLSDPDAIGRVEAYLADGHAATQAAAAEALGRADANLVLPLLLRALDRPESRHAAVRALGHLGPERCMPLAALLEDRDPRVRQAAAEGLTRCATAEVRQQITDALGSEEDAAVRRALIGALGAAGGSEAVDPLEARLDDADPAARYAAIRALGRTAAPQALRPLVRVLTEPDGEFRAAALHALGELGDPRAAQPLARHLAAADDDIRLTAAFALRDLAAPQAVEYLAAALDDRAWAVRHAAVRTLAILGATAVLPRLSELADSDPDPLVRDAARNAARALANERAGGAS